MNKKHLRGVLRFLWSIVAGGSFGYFCLTYLRIWYEHAAPVVAELLAILNSFPGRCACCCVLYTVLVGLSLVFAKTCEARKAEAIHRKKMNP